MQRNEPNRRARAFTLVELILVMVLLCVILGLAAPSLSRSIRQRDLRQDAVRLLAVTEYARDEAASQGVPMVVWIDADTGRFGARAKTGFEEAGARPKEFILTEGLHFEAGQNSLSVAGENDAVEYEPDGTLDPSSQASLRLVDRSNSAVEVTQTTDRGSYEIVKDQP